MNRAHYLLGSILLFSLSPLAAVANPGALEINQDCVAVGCFAGDTAGYPVTISQPGSYILSSDLLQSGSANAIQITASPVDIDLNGHTIDGGGRCTGSPATTCTNLTGGRGIQVSASVSTVVRIRNGTVRGFGGGGVLIFAADDGTVLDHLTVTENSYGVLIDGNTTKSTTRIRDSQIVRNQNEGASITNGPSVIRLENSSVVGNGSTGIVVGSGSTLVGNLISNNSGVGVSCGSPGDFCALGQNSFAGNNGSAAATQFTVTTLSNMGGNVCLGHANSVCP